MDLIQNIFTTSLIVGITLIAIQLFIVWLFIKTAVASGVKTGILKAHEEIERNKTNPPPTEKELLEEEMKGWQ